MTFKQWFVSGVQLIWATSRQSFYSAYAMRKSMMQKMPYYGISVLLRQATPKRSLTSLSAMSMAAASLQHATLALTWCRRAADLGNPSAQCHLGFILEYGKGVAIDVAQAVAWYTRAAEASNASAQFNLALCYENGKGVAADAC